MARRILQHKSEEKNIEGIGQFSKKLERNFFANVDVRQSSMNTCKPELIIDLYCNYSLTHCLYHFNKGTWGNFESDLHGATKTELEELLKELQKRNPFKIEIAELSVHFTDVSLIISKIHNDSIAKQFGNIISAVSDNFVYMTKHLTEMPYEIFVPVFTEFSLLEYANPQNTYDGHLRQNIGFFDYWALYFHSTEKGEASIYDLRNREITKGDFLLVH